MPDAIMRQNAARWTFAAFLLPGFVGCAENRPSGEVSSGAAPADSARRVVVYTAHDRNFSEPILSRFTERTGIRVDAVYDTEATKTVGLVNRIRAERERPRCDLFWNNEILNTLTLKAEGLLQPPAVPPAEAANFPAWARDPEGVWYGFAARARVLLVNAELVPEAELPRSIFALGEARWKGRAGIAKPLFGTTASHVACLFAQLGPQEAQRRLLEWKANEIQIVAGNKTAAQMVAAGALAFALTDTDDAIIEVEAGRPVRIVFPDGGPDQIGTPVLPNTLAIVRGAPNPGPAAELLNYLLSPEVEKDLALGPAAQIPLNRRTEARSRAAPTESFAPMPVDFAEAAARFPEARAFVEREFLR